MPNGQSLLEHVVETASSVFDRVVLLGSAANLPDKLRTWPRLPDAEPLRGPLSGLCSLLHFADPGWTMLLSCDLPLLSPCVLHRLLAAASPDADVVAFAADAAARSFHPCCALYHSRMATTALHELQTGTASLHDLLSKSRLVVLQPTPLEAAALTNVNTPAEFDAAIRSAMGSCPQNRLGAG
jgi:molybdopterin-guanine dinucleotide biosynthesis protein A